MATILDDAAARYGAAGHPRSDGYSAAAGTSDVVAVAAQTPATRRVFVETIDMVADDDGDLAVLSGSSVLWGPIPARGGAQYAASNLIGEPGASIRVTRGASVQLGGGVVWRTLG